MPFTGKSTYGAGADLPEIAEDVSDIVGIVSPYETPLLNVLGDAKRPAMSTLHEWVEDTLLPNSDTINQTVFSPNPTAATEITVVNGGRFRIGDLVRPGNSKEVMLAANVVGNVVSFVRGYGGTTAFALANQLKLTILGNAALEGAEADAPRFTNRVRKQNWTQIFASTVDVSGSMQAARQHGIADEVDYQKQERLRELMRDLENCVINGVAPASTAQGSGTVRRSMNGLLKLITTNSFIPDDGKLPPGGGVGGTDLNEALLNVALRLIWEQSNGPVDTILVGGTQKRRINAFISSNQRYQPEDETFRNMVGVYESDFGNCRVVTSRWVPADAVVLLASSRIEVPPLRSFQYQSLGAKGDSVTGQVVGEYTLELRNENAHGVIRGLTMT
jgi:Family of unknown function (DUF5309)